MKATDFQMQDNSTDEYQVNDFEEMENDAEVKEILSKNTVGFFNLDN